MAEIRIDATRAIELLREVVAESGEDYRYELIETPYGPVCHYAHDDAPSCLVGHALHRAGVTVEQLASLDKHDNHIASVELPAEVEITDEAQDVFAVAQDTQDDGKPWGVALSVAERAYEDQTSAGES
jgi:hypothetical protein